MTTLRETTVGEEEDLLLGLVEDTVRPGGYTSLGRRVVGVTSFVILVV